MRSSTIFTSALQAGMFIAAADAAALLGNRNPATGGTAIKAESSRGSSISESKGPYKAASTTTSSSTVIGVSSLLQLLSLRDVDIAPATTTTHSPIAAATFTAQWQEWYVSASGGLSSKKPEFTSATRTASVVIPANNYSSKSPYLNPGYTTSVTVHHTTFSTIVPYANSKETGHSSGFAKESTRIVDEYNKPTVATAVEASHYTPEVEAAKPAVGEEEWQAGSEEDQHSPKPVATTSSAHHFSKTSAVAPHQTTQKEDFVDVEEEWQAWSEEEDYEHESKPAPTTTTQVYHHTTSVAAGPRQTTQKNQSIKAAGEGKNGSDEQDLGNESAQSTTTSYSSGFTTVRSSATASAGLGDLTGALGALDLLG